MRAGQTRTLVVTGVGQFEDWMEHYGAGVVDIDWGQGTVVRGLRGVVWGYDTRLKSRGREYLEEIKSKDGKGRW